MFYKNVWYTSDANLLLTWLLIISKLLMKNLNLFHMLQLEYRTFFDFRIYSVLYYKNSSINIYRLIERACPLHKFRFNRISIYEYLYFYSLNFTAMPFFSSTSLTCPSFFSIFLSLFLFLLFNYSWTFYSLLLSLLFLSLFYVHM